MTLGAVKPFLAWPVSALNLRLGSWRRTAWRPNGDLGIEDVFATTSISRPRSEIAGLEMNTAYHIAAQLVWRRPFVL